MVVIGFVERLHSPYKAARRDFKKAEQTWKEQVLSHLDLPDDQLAKKLSPLKPFSIPLSIKQKQNEGAHGIYSGISNSVEYTAENTPGKRKLLLAHELLHFCQELFPSLQQGLFGRVKKLNRSLEQHMVNSVKALKEENPESPTFDLFKTFLNTPLKDRTFFKNVSSRSLQSLRLQNLHEIQAHTLTNKKFRPDIRLNEISWDSGDEYKDCTLQALAVYKAQNRWLANELRLRRLEDGPIITFLKRIKDFITLS